MSECECDWRGGVRARCLTTSELSEARYSNATTMSVMEGRRLGCSWRHIAVIATAFCKQRKGYLPSKRGSTICETFLRSLKYGRAWNQKHHHMSYVRMMNNRYNNDDIMLYIFIYPCNQALLPLFSSDIHCLASGDQLEQDDTKAVYIRFKS